MKLFGLKDEDGVEYALLIDYKTLGLERVDTLPKFKVNDWVIGEKGCLPSCAVKITSVDRGLYWFINEFNESTYHPSVTARLATKEEIIISLCKVVEEKYVGKTVKCLADGIVYRISSYHSYDVGMDMLWYLSDTGIIVKIYDNGVWAKIIPEKKQLPITKDEFDQFLTAWETSFMITHAEFLKKYED